MGIGRKKSGSLLRSQSDRVIGSEKVVTVRVVPKEFDDLDTFEDENFINRNKISEDPPDIMLKSSNKSRDNSNSRFKKFQFLVGNHGSSNKSMTPKHFSDKSDSIKRTGMIYSDSDLGDSCNSSEVDSSTPVLLSVKKRVMPDSGHDSTSSYNSSPATSVKGKTNQSSKPKGGIFRLFHRSATLLFNHSTQEFHPNKPYKSASSLNAKELRQQQYKHKKQQQGQYHKYKDLNNLNAYASSSSSLNSSVLHHHLEHVDAGRNGMQTSGNAPMSLPVDALVRPHTLHSSSNSVISSVDSSNYDSGAFSRTSSPEIVTDKKAADHVAEANLSANKRKSATLGMYAPLSAPSLVLEACGGRRRHFKSGWDISGKSSLPWNETSHDSVDAAHILACLNAASQSSAIPSSLPYYGILKPEDYHKINSNQDNDVSVTIGENTKLTIAPSSLPTFFSKSNLRRSRSGLPLLGTSGLHKSLYGSSKDLSSLNCPVKPVRTSSPIKNVNRTKISTVYLSGPGNSDRVSRSESFVTLSNANSANKSVLKCCNEKVTVNGQHHCGKLCMTVLGKPNNVTDKVTDIVDGQPGSIIQV